MKKNKRKVKENDFMLDELLRLNGALIKLGDALVKSIENYGKFGKYGKSPNMKNAIDSWNTFIDDEFIEIK